MIFNCDNHTGSINKLLPDFLFVKYFLFGDIFIMCKFPNEWNEIVCPFHNMLIFLQIIETTHWTICFMVIILMSWNLTLMQLMQIRLLNWSGYKKLWVFWLNINTMFRWQWYWRILKLLFVNSNIMSSCLFSIYFFLNHRLFSIWLFISYLYWALTKNTFNHW